MSGWETRSAPGRGAINMSELKAAPSVRSVNAVRQTVKARSRLGSFQRED